MGLGKRARLDWSRNFGIHLAEIPADASLSRASGDPRGDSHDRWPLHLRKVPLGEWAKDAFQLQRNPYDRLGHFAQGFIPAILVRELLLRKAQFERNFWLLFLTVSVCLAFSAFYELIEWWTALLTGEAATDFLGTQGDVWDTQWDMFLALAGAVCSLAFLSARHDRSLARMN